MTQTHVRCQKRSCASPSVTLVTQIQLKGTSAAALNPGLEQGQCRCMALSAHFAPRPVTSVGCNVLSHQVLSTTASSPELFDSTHALLERSQVWFAWDRGIGKLSTDGFFQPKTNIETITPAKLLLQA